MIKRKRKLTEEKRRAILVAAAREMERRKLNRKRLLVQKRGATGVLYIQKIHPHCDNPRIVAMGLAQIIFDCPSSGAREVAWVMERKGNDQRFIRQMLIALGKYLENGQPIFDDLELEIADIKRRQSDIRYSEIVRKLEKRHPNLTTAALEKRLTRLGHIPREYLEPPP